MSPNSHSKKWLREPTHISHISDVRWRLGDHGCQRELDGGGQKKLINGNFVHFSYLLNGSAFQAPDTLAC